MVNTVDSNEECWSEKQLMQYSHQIHNIEIIPNTYNIERT